MSRHKRVQIDAGEFERGDPAVAVLGREEERPARKHAPQRPKPPLGVKGIGALMRERLEELRPLVEEHRQLAEAQEALDRALQPFDKQRRRR